MRFRNYIKRILTYVINGQPQQVVYPQICLLKFSKLLEGRTAIVTGGTSGIGYAIAKVFLNAGATVIITGRNQGRITTSVEKLKAETSCDRVYGKVLNNAEVSTFDETFNDILSHKETSKIDILVNNAGVNFKGMPNATEEEYDKVMDTNLKGVFFLSQLFGKYLVKNGIRGNILNIASSSSLRPADSAYTLSKWGIRALTLGLAKSLAKNGITVNGIAPGPTATPMMIKDKNQNMA